MWTSSVQDTEMAFRLSIIIISFTLVITAAAAATATRRSLVIGGQRYLARLLVVATVSDSAAKSIRKKAVFCVDNVNDIRAFVSSQSVDVLSHVLTELEGFETVR